MADQSHLDILAQGVEAWDAWRERDPYVEPDLTDANLSGADLTFADFNFADFTGSDLSMATLQDASLMGANLSDANLSGADLSGADLPEATLSRAILSEANLNRADLRDARLGGANLSGADLRDASLMGANLSWARLWGANLTEANLHGAVLHGADLSGADLSGAYLADATLSRAILSEANLSDADLSDADLTYSVLIKTNLQRTTLAGCTIYGISAWSLKLEGAAQQGLNISDRDSRDPDVMVDNLEVAQFIYLLLNNEKVREVLDTVTSKAVLILGRFTSDRKAVLDAIRDELRQRGYLPILFDFDKPAGRDLTETISTLAHMARFIIADITEAKSIPQELQAIVPNLPSVPVQPLLLTSEHEYGMFEHFRRYPWVLDTYYYDNLDDVLASVEDKVITPAESKVRELSS